MGCGWYGFALAKTLIADGYHVKGSTTRPEKLTSLAEAGIDAYLIDFDLANTSINIDFFKCDLLIISIPPGRNSPSLADYPSKINNSALQAIKASVKQIIFISSTGVYQDGNFVVDEAIIPCPNTNIGKVIFEAEGVLTSNLSFTTTVIRFAGLIGPDRNLAKYFAGKTEISNGLAPINLIHLQDCIGLTTAIINQSAFGKIYHGVNPNHPTRKDFYTKACANSGLDRPQFRDEILAWKQIESKNVSEVLGYEYVFENWDKYFELLKY